MNLRSFAIVVCFGSMLPATIAAAAAQDIGIPDFSVAKGWQADRPFLIPSPTGPRPVGPDPAVYDKAHPFNAMTMFPIVDAANPNLLPWVADRLRANNERVLAGKPLHVQSSSCQPVSIPFFHQIAFFQPIHIVQSPTEVIIVHEQNQEVRRVLLNQEHSKNPKLSWYGESVGHYENGDTLVVDTIGLNDRTILDNFLTPHSAALHVVERWKLAANGPAIEVNLRFDDPGAFKAPYELTQRYHRSNEPWLEQVCAENPLGPLDQGLDPIPQTARSDF